MAASKFRTFLKWAAVLFWFALASAFIIAMNASTTRAFDPDNRLAMQLMSLDFEQNLVKAIRGAKPINGDRVVHFFSKGGCFCQTLAQSHVEKINESIHQTNTEIVAIDIDQHPDLQKMIPSTPAVAVISKREKLLYFGPYSQGSGCFSSSGEVDAIVKRAFVEPKSQQSNAVQTVIAAEARGCYCEQT